jgi:hypothetical protein
LDFIYKGLECTALVGGSGGPVFLKLNNWLKIEGSGSDLWLENPDEVGGGCFHKVNDDQLWSDRSVSLLTNLFSEGEAKEMLF